MGQSSEAFFTDIYHFVIYLSIVSHMHTFFLPTVCKEKWDTVWLNGAGAGAARKNIFDYVPPQWEKINSLSWWQRWRLFLKHKVNGLLLNQEVFVKDELHSTSYCLEEDTCGDEGAIMVFSISFYVLSLWWFARVRVHTNIVSPL